jgi:hypothetical protein
MRRSVSAIRVIAPALVLGLILTGCGSTTGAKRTSTVYQTVTSGAGTGSAATGGSITVAVPSGSDAVGSAASGSATGSGAGAGSGTAATGQPAGSGTAKATSSSAAKPSTTAAKPSTSAAAKTTAKVDPLTIDCGSLLAPNDVKRVTGQTIPANGSRIKDVANSKIGSTGSIRCLYGISGGKHKLSLRMTKYTSADAAAQQVKVTVQSETDLGAKASVTTVGGLPAHVLLRDGGLIDVQYGNWTLAIAVQDGFLKGDQPAQLTKLADLALARALKSAS